MRSLENEQDIQDSRKDSEGTPFQRFLKIPDTKTPWYILSMSYCDSYVHWIDLENGQTQRLTCGGGHLGKGYDTDHCPVCAYCSTLYQESKALADSDRNLSDKIKKRANTIRASFEALFIAVRGNGVLERIKVRVKGKIVQKKRFVADFDPESGVEDAKVEVGLLRMSKSAWLNFSDLKDDDRYPFIRSGADLAERVVWSTRKTKKNRRFPEVEWTPEAKVSDPPDVEYDAEELNPEKFFEIKEEELRKVYNYLTGEEIEEIADDEEVELEDDVVEDDEPGDDYLDDVEGDEETEEETVEEETVEEEIEEEEVIEDEEVEEEIVEDETEDAEEKPEPQKRKTGSSKASKDGSSASAKTTTAKKTTTTRKSGSGKTGAAKSGRSSL